MISDDQIFYYFKKVRGTPQWCPNMMCWQNHEYLVYQLFFFLTWIATFFKWTNAIKIVAQRYEKILTDEYVNNMDWNTRVQYLKRNPISVTW